MINLYQEIDRVFHNYLSSNPSVGDKWLLWQTLLTGASRRQWLQQIDVSGFTKESKVLDVGTGFGILAFDLSARTEVQIEGIDRDPEKIQIANHMLQQLQQSQGRNIRFRTGDTYDLNFDDNMFDMVMVRFVFQHLESPLQAAKEIWRVLKPGGSVYVNAVDDGLSIVHPKDRSYEKLKEVLTEVQRRRGGDRTVGRKIPGYLHRAGFEVVQAELRPYTRFNAALAEPEAGEARRLELSFLKKRFVDIYDDAIAMNLIHPEDFHQQLTALDDYQPEFEAESQLYIMGKKLDHHDPSSTTHL